MATKLTARDVGAFEGAWTQRVSERRTRGPVTVRTLEAPEEAHEVAHYRLPVGWEQMGVEAAATAAVRVRHNSFDERIADYEQRTEVTMPRDPQPLGVPAEPKGAWPTSMGMPLVATHKVDRSHLWDLSLGCPCCGESYQSIQWDADGVGWCDACGYSPSWGLEVDPVCEAPPTRWGTSTGTTPYRDAEMAASNVLYHEGEAVVPETDPPSIDLYPASWDKALTDTEVRPHPEETRREKARPIRERLERLAELILKAELDATIV